MVVVIDRSWLPLEERLYFEYAKWRGMPVLADLYGRPGNRISPHFEGFRDRTLGNPPKKFETFKEYNLQLLHKLGLLSCQEQYDRGYEDGFAALLISSDDDVISNDYFFERSRNPVRADSNIHLTQNFFYL